MIKKAIEIKQKKLGANHPDLALDIGNLGLVQYEQGRLEQAEKLYLQAIELTKKFYSDNHPTLSVYLGNLGLVYYDQGRLDDAK